MTLVQAIQQVRSAHIDRENWLFIANDAVELCPTSDVDFGVIDFDEDSDREVFPEGFKERGLYSTIDLQTVEDCIGWADRLVGRTDDLAAADCIRYYIRFDAFPQSIGAPDPPPWKETQARLDREFYDRLGAEDASRPCRSEGCTRGSVQFSVLCRSHHFERIQRRPSPFAD
jgi:hypothetical protein